MRPPRVPRFTLKNAPNVFGPQCTGGIKKHNNHRSFGFVLKKTQAGKSHDDCEITVLKYLRFQNAFRPYENEKLVFSNFSCLKSVFRKLRFRDGLVRTVGQALEVKLRCQIPLA